MAKQVETIWSYLKSLGYSVEPRPADKTVQLVLESTKLNNAQKKRMCEVWEVTEKLDGVYSLVTLIPIINGEGKVYQIRHWGRSGKAQMGCYGLDRKVGYQFSSKVPLGPMVLISEVTSDDPLAKLSGYLNPNRVEDSDFTPTNMRDNFHDIISLDSFIKGATQADRAERLANLHNFLNGTKYNIPECHGLTLEEAYKYAEEHIYPRGGEGLVCRDPNAIWEAGKRNETMIKIKEKLSFDVTVVGYCTGREGSKYEDVVGKLLVAFRAFGKPYGEPIMVPISGMTDDQRKLWIEHPELIVGATVKMDAKSYTETGNLREPRFKEERHDKSSQFPTRIDLERAEAYVKAKCMWVEHNWRMV